MSIAKGVAARTLLLTAGVIVAFPADAAALKCGMLGVIHVIDGVPTRLDPGGPNPFYELPAEDVHAVQMVCWDPVEGTFNHSPP